MDIEQALIRNELFFSGKKKKVKYSECNSRCRKIVIPILFTGNLILACMKTTIGIMGNSAGLIADGAHSATDAVSAFILFLGIRYTDKPADEEHPYGHQNFEFILAKVISVFLLLVGFYILFSSIYHMVKGHFVTPDYVTLLTAIFSIVANEIMAGYGTCVGTQLNSPAILSASYEIKADAMSSVAIAIGIIGAELGYPYLDPIAAAVVSLIIIKNSVHMLMSAMDGLMDASVESKTRRKISNIIEKNPEVLGINFLRTRSTGRFISIEAGISLASERTVEEGDNIAREIRSDIVALVDNVGEVEIALSSVDVEMTDEPGEDFELVPDLA